ncbi:MAG: hypothetical protein ACXVCY_00075 [Pseudobdellovibrionaceae bacterium]
MIIKSWLSTLKLSPLISLAISFSAFAGQFDDYPGSVPLKYEKQAASDLFYGGKVLTPDEARALYETKKITDLSHIDPDQSSQIWKNVFNPTQRLDTVDLEVLTQGEIFTYISDKPAPNGSFAFLAQKTTVDGRLKTYQVYLDLKGHNMVLRRELLRKIGYNIPPLARIKNMRLQFQGAFSKREFAKRVADLTFVESKRWITSNLDNDDGNLDLQDVFIFEGPDDPFYNLARGQMDSSIIRGRRVLNALLIPYSITDTPESINLASWVGAGVFNGSLYLPCPDAEAFSPSYEDALWIARRILKLNRQDWTSIVSAADLPTEVAVVLTEKLIERRNTLRTSLGLIYEFSEIPTTPRMTLGTHLKNGKLIGESWTGYARHFAGTDPASPLAPQEVWALFKSKFMTNLISNLMSQFNTRFIPATDIAYKMFDHQLNVAAQNFANFLMTKQVKQSPVAFWSTPFYNGQLIASREIVSGTFMGSDNLVQLADTIGFSVNLGFAATLDNLPSPVNASGDLQLSLVHKLSHLKPLNSIKAGLSEPFKNLFIPYLRRETRLPLDSALALESQSKVLSADDLKKKLDDNLASFNKVFGVGESLIVQSSISPNGYFKISKGITADLAVYAKINDELMEISRTQILRKDAKTVHVYIDPASYNTFGLAIGLAFGIPIIELGGSWESGFARTHYFSINLDTDLNKNPDFFKNLRLFTAALRGGSLELLRTYQKPYVLAHNFYDDRFNFRFLWWRYVNDVFEDNIQITHPQGAKASFIRKSLGERSGVDYESLATDLLNYLISDKLNVGISVGSSANPNPGSTIYGKAISRQTVGETEVNPKNGLGVYTHPLDNTFISENYRWKGWSMSRKQLLKVADEINQKFDSQVIQPGQLNDMESLQFYTIAIQVALYREGVQNLISHSHEELTKIFRNYSINPSPQDNPKTRDTTGFIIDKVSRLSRQATEEIQKSPEQIDYKHLIEWITEIVDTSEVVLKLQGFKLMVGGEKNFFLNGSIIGFRKGSENGNQPLQMQTIGKIGSDAPMGPLQQIQNNMNISPGEFNISWVINGL